MWPVRSKCSVPSWESQLREHEWGRGGRTFMNALPTVTGGMEHWLFQGKEHRELWACVLRRAPWGSTLAASCPQVRIKAL